MCRATVAVLILNCKMTSATVALVILKVKMISATSLLRVPAAFSATNAAFDQIIRAGDLPCFQNLEGLKGTRPRAFKTRQRLSCADLPGFENLEGLPHRLPLRRYDRRKITQLS
jgi:hypothetical protein